MFEIDGSIDFGLRNSFIVSFDLTENRGHATSSGMSEVHLTDVDSWVDNPFGDFSSGDPLTAR